MAKRSPRRKSSPGRSGSSRNKNPSLFGRVWPLLWRLGLVALVVLAGWTVYLDAKVTSRFEGRRFEVPSRVYARPLELYEGAGVSAEALQRELQMANYSRAAGNRPGTFSRNGNRFVIHTRGFRFADGSEPPRQIRLSISGDQVQQLSVLSGPAAPILRLEPVQIGGIYPASQEDRVLVQLDEVPGLLVKTLLAVEDREFFTHHGVSPMAIARAMVANIRAGGIVQGGSTITQQLVKNFFLTRDQTFVRKANEAIMALLLEAHYNKQDILETYLNEVYLGQAGARGVHGVGLASQFYFARPVTDLEVHEIALLVGLIKGASYYDPRRNPERARARRDLVIQVMEEQSLIDRNTALRAKGQPLGVRDKPSWSANRYPAYIDLVRRHLARDYRDEDLRSEGLRIFTTLDPAIQYAAEYAVRQTLDNMDADQGARLESALVVTARDSGEVVALVGGRDPDFAGFNRALDASRPIGSLIKPFIYLVALQRPEDYTLITPIQDKGFSLVFDDGRRWEPKNYDEEERGEVPLHEALAKSYNLPAVRVGLDVGVDAVRDTLQMLGVTSPISQYPSMLLGSVSMTPVTVAQLYQSLATSGFNTPLRSIRQVTDAEGEPLSRYHLEVNQVADPAAVHLVQYAMQETVQEGTGRSVYRYLPEALSLAGKTGTTDDGRDSWFAGFSGDYLAVAWLGRDDNGPTMYTGASGALPVWSSFMARVPQHGLSPVVPDGVNYHWVDDQKQALTEEGCSNARLMPFIAGSEPQQSVSCDGQFSRRIRSWFQGLFN